MMCYVYAIIMEQLHMNSVDAGADWQLYPMHNQAGVARYAFNS